MSFRYSVILGNLGNTKDRFCSSYKDNPDTLSMLRAAAKIPHVQGIELVGSWDIRHDNVKTMKAALHDAGLQCVSIIPDLFADKIYWKGSYSSRDAKVRRHAIEYSKQMCEVALELGCDLLNIWPGQDGFDYLLATDYDSYRSHFVESLTEVAQAFPQLRFALEYKPKEPRCFSLLARMADTLLVCTETNLANVGVCIDTGHSYVAGESVGEAIVLAKRAGNRLFHMHFNDNHGSWDDDMIAGTVHSTTYIETLYWLQRTNYEGWLSMDQYPYREEAAEAIGESICWLQSYEKIVRENYREISDLTQQNNAVATSRFLRRVMFQSEKSLV